LRQPWIVCSVEGHFGAVFEWVAPFVAIKHAFWQAAGARAGGINPHE
jgi:hypothetical protein